MKEKIKEFVHRMNHVTFWELTNAVPDSAGERAMFVDNDSLMVWHGVSIDFAEAVEQLRRDNEIVYRPCSPMVYVTDRSPLPNYLVAKKIKKYTQRHWFPVCLCRA